MSENLEGNPNEIHDLRGFAIRAMVHEASVVHEAYAQGLHQTKIENYDQSEAFIAEMIANTTFDVVPKGRAWSSGVRNQIRELLQPYFISKQSWDGTGISKLDEICEALEDITTGQTND